MVAGKRRRVGVRRARRRGVGNTALIAACTHVMCSLRQVGSGDSTRTFVRLLEGRDEAADVGAKMLDSPDQRRRGWLRGSRLRDMVVRDDVQRTG